MRYRFAWSWMIGALLALPLSAKTTNCTAAMVSGGFCSSTSGVLLSYFVPSTTSPGATDPWTIRLRDAFAGLANYQDTIPCEAAPKLVDEIGILQRAEPGDGTCTVGLIGTEIPNPQTKGGVADQFLRFQIMNAVLRWESQQIDNQAEIDKESIESVPIPENGD